MKKYFEFDNDTAIIMKKNSLISALKNQHPLMFIWFTFMSLSMGLVYVLLFTNL